MTRNQQPAERGDPPFAKSDWIAEDSMHPDIAKVRNVYWDDICNEWIADIVLYSPSGDRIGRRSARQGGPSGFEPAVPCANWKSIIRPTFPLSTDMTGYRDWRPYLTFKEPK